MKSLLRNVIALLSLLAWASQLDCSQAFAGGPAEFMMAASVNGRVLEGQPLNWTDQQMYLLGRDGALYGFDPQAAKKSRKIGAGFRGYTITEMRNRLRNEFDKTFEISTTHHFVVAHPKGEWSAWANRLESLYRSFTHYMQVRGFSIQQPQVPLVAIVFRSQEAYFRYASSQGKPVPAGALGHYDPETNRILLYEASNQAGKADWSLNAETIIHEATHQTAYNVGVHRRFAEQPRWLIEGLAMMFEARGVWDGRSVYNRKDRINNGRLDDFRSYLDNRPDNLLTSLVASDQLFRSDAGAAYAEAWTLSFFLCETRPQDYSRYLARVAAREAFSAYPAKARLIDFMSVFGKDLDLLDAQLRRFVAELN
jgi:hypothetical protein